MKKGIIINVSVLLIGVLAYATVQWGSSRSQVNSNTSETANPPSATPQVNPIPKTLPLMVMSAPIKIPYAMSTPGKLHPYTVPNSTKTISFHYDDSVQSRNPVLDVYLDNQLIRPVGKGLTVNGYGPVNGVFSPDNKYMAFLTQGVCGGFCANYDLHIVDIANATMFAAHPPRKISDFPGNATPYVYVIPYISYEWNQDDSLSVTFFFVGDILEGRDNITEYRISPKELWRYDISTNKYTFLQTLPE
jgi:hypothetical protein